MPKTEFYLLPLHFTSLSSRAYITRSNDVSIFHQLLFYLLYDVEINNLKM